MHGFQLTIEYIDYHSTRNQPANPSVIVVSVLTRIMHEHFCLNRRSAVTTEPSAGGLAPRSLTVLHEYASGPHGSVRWSCDAAQQFCDESARIILAGCSERLSSKAAASAEARRTLRYVEPLSAARTRLADFINSLLAIRRPRVYCCSDGHLDSCDPLHIGAEIAETGGD